MAFALVTLFGAQTGWDSSSSQNSDSITGSAGKRIIGYFYDIDPGGVTNLTWTSRVRVVEPVLSAKTYAVGNGAVGTLANGLNAYTLPDANQWQRYVAYADPNANGNRTTYNFFEIPVDEWDIQLQCVAGTPSATTSVSLWAVLEEGVA